MQKDERRIAVFGREDFKIYLWVNKMENGLVEITNCVDNQIFGKVMSLNLRGVENILYCIKLIIP